ncbi:MAG: DUF2284 domain-containing protein [Pseudomonadota bacterium]
MRAHADPGPEGPDCVLTRARPSPEGLGVDVFSTARAAGMPIAVLTATDQVMDRYAMLPVE